jgi:DNA polymerase
MIKLEKLRFCQKCSLAQTRRQIVIGRGEVPADILMLGEGPGIAEDLVGEAFAGPSGALLDRMILDARTVSCDELDQPSIFMTNIVLCHPTEEFAGDNRTPKQNEVLACAKNIMEIYKVVSPKRVVFLGDEAAYYYKKEFPSAIKIHHPSYLLRTGGLESRHYLHAVRLLSDVIRLVNGRG